MDAVRVVSNTTVRERQVNKQELIEAVATRLNASKAQAAAIVDTFFGTDGIIASELKNGGNVQLTGFGNFETRKRAARTGRNPQTGQAIDITASTVPAFRAGKALKDLVNQGGRKDAG